MVKRILRAARPATAPPQPPQPPHGAQGSDEESAHRVDHVAIIAKYAARVKNRGTAIRAFCIACSGGSLAEVRDCQIKKCVLFLYRMGADPGNKKTLDRLARGEGSDDNAESDAT